MKVANSENSYYSYGWINNEKKLKLLKLRRLEQCPPLQTQALEGWALLVLLRELGWSWFCKCWKNGNSCSHRTKLSLLGWRSLAEVRLTGTIVYSNSQETHRKECLPSSPALHPPSSSSLKLLLLIDPKMWTQSCLMEFHTVPVQKAEAELRCHTVYINVQNQEAIILQSWGRSMFSPEFSWYLQILFFTTYISLLIIYLINPVSFVHF